MASRREINRILSEVQNWNLDELTHLRDTIDQMISSRLLSPESPKAEAENRFRLEIKMIKSSKYRLYGRPYIYLRDRQKILPDVYLGAFFFGREERLFKQDSLPNGGIRFYANNDFKFIHKLTREVKYLRILSLEPRVRQYDGDKSTVALLKTQELNAIGEPDPLIDSQFFPICMEREYSKRDWECEGIRTNQVTKKT